MNAYQRRIYNARWHLLISAGPHSIARHSIFYQFLSGDRTMTRQRTISMLAAFLFTLAMMIVAMPERASAQQNPNCCSYSVEIAGVKPECFPIRLKTQWVPGYTDIITYAANGVYWNPIPGPCPPAPPFDWVSLQLGINPIHLGETKTITIGGCCYKVTATLNPNFCILIRITPC